MFKAMASIISLFVITFASSTASASAPSYSSGHDCVKLGIITTSSNQCGLAKREFFSSRRNGADQDTLNGILASFSSNSAPRSVPELSASAAPISIALVGGLLAFGLERRRKQAKK